MAQGEARGERGLASARRVSDPLRRPGRAARPRPAAPRRTLRSPGPPQTCPRRAAGVGGRRLAGRFARDDAADRSTRASRRRPPNCGARSGASRRGHSRGAGGGRGRAQAVLAERRKLDDEVERRADSLSEPREHAFGKVRAAVGWKRRFAATFLAPPPRYAASGMAEPFRHRIRVRFRVRPRRASSSTRTTSCTSTSP